MTKTHDLTILGARLLDASMTESTAGGIRIVNGRITAIGPDIEVGPNVLNAEGKTIIPGLIDAHFHAYAIGFDLDRIEQAPLSYVSLKATRRLAAALRRGFTTVRDVAGGDHGLARAIREDVMPAPRYFFTGAGMSQTGGHGDPRDGDYDSCLQDGCLTEVIDGVENMRKAVRERLFHGAHAVKIMTSGGVISLSDPLRIPQYSAEEIRVAVEEATRRGSYVVAHAYSPEAIRHSVENGVRSIEHGNLLDAESAELMARHGAYLVPTLAAYDAMDRRGDDLGLAAVSQAKNREVLDFGKRAIGIATEAGVKIGFGSDLMGDLEDDQLRGLELQIEVQGVLAALHSATVINAELLGLDDVGLLREGYIGDVLILDGDPLADPAVITSESREKIVIQGGQIRV